MSCFVQVIRCVEAGKTLDRPPGCPDAVYQLMLASWRRQPQERLDIKDQRQCLDLLAQTSSSSLACLTGTGQSHAVAIDNASLQHPQSMTYEHMTTSPRHAYLELIPSITDT